MDYSTRLKSTRCIKKTLSMRPLWRRLLPLKKRRLVRAQKAKLLNRLLLTVKLRKSLLSTLKISLGLPLTDTLRICLSSSFRAVLTARV